MNISKIQTEDVHTLIESVPPHIKDDIITTHAKLALDLHEARHSYDWFIFWI